MTTEYSTVMTQFPSTPGGGQPPADAGLDVKRMLRLRAPIIICVSLLLAIPSALAAWFLTPLEYEASARIKFKTFAQNILEDNRQRASVPYNIFVSIVRAAYIH